MELWKLLSLLGFLAFDRSLWLEVLNEIRMVLNIDLLISADAQVEVLLETDEAWVVVPL